MIRLEYFFIYGKLAIMYYVCIYKYVYSRYYKNNKLIIILSKKKLYRQKKKYKDDE